MGQHFRVNCNRRSKTFYQSSTYLVLSRKSKIQVPEDDRAICVTNTVPIATSPPRLQEQEENILNNPSPSLSKQPASASSSSKRRQRCRLRMESYTPDRTSPAFHIPSVATQLSSEMIEMIFDFVAEDVMSSPLPQMPLKAENSAGLELKNDRLTTEEVRACKRLIVKKQLHNMARVCKNWWAAAGCCRGFEETIIFGEVDAKLAIANPSAWFRLGKDAPLKLTVACTMPTFIQLIDAITPPPADLVIDMTHSPEPDANPSHTPKASRDWPKPSTLLIDSLTLLHSFAPEQLDSATRSRLHAMITRLRVRKLHFECYAGEVPLRLDSLDRIASATRRWQPVPIPPQPIDGHYPNRDRFLEIPANWIPTPDYPTATLEHAMKKWRGTLETLSIRCNFTDIRDELRASIKFGLRNFDYHFVALSQYKKRQHRLWRSLNFGSLGSCDQILLWDLKLTESKWGRRKLAKEAGEKGEVPASVAQDGQLTAPFAWTVHTAYDLWYQQREKAGWKGQSKDCPWYTKKEVKIDALAEYILWRNVVRPFNEGREQETLEDGLKGMISWVVNQRVRSPYEKPPQPGQLMAITGGQAVSSAWVKQRIRKVSRNNKVQAIWAEEMKANEPISRVAQDEYNRKNLRPFLREQSDQDLDEMVEKLKQKMGARQLFVRMNWPIYHIGVPGVRLMVEHTEA